MYKKSSGFKMKSPLLHQPWAPAHKEKVSHSGTAEAHGEKPVPVKNYKKGYYGV